MKIRKGLRCRQLLSGPFTLEFKRNTFPVPSQLPRSQFLPDVKHTLELFFDASSVDRIRIRIDEGKCVVYADLEFHLDFKRFSKVQKF